MKKKDKDFVVKYQEILLVLQAMIKAREELIDIPINSLIEKRLVWFEKQRH